MTDTTSPAASPAPLTVPVPMTPPAAPPVIESPGTPSPPSAASEAPAAAPIVPPVGAAAVLESPPPTDDMIATAESMVFETVKSEAEIQRGRLLGDLHHIVGFVEEMGADIEAHAMAAAKAGEHDVHVGLSRLSTLFGEFRNGLLSAGRALPAKLASDAAGLVAKAKA
jgi:hypothetical protein